MITDAARWERVKTLFQQTVDREPADRDAWLSTACGGDEDLRRQVESLLHAHAGAIEFLSAPLDADQFADSLVPDDAPLRIGAYRIVRELGRGGMGTVYLAERDDPTLRKTVAIKVVRVESPSILRRFQTETRILAGLEHSGIARLYDGGTTAEGLPYYVMEYVAGESLIRYCEAGRLPIEQRLRLFRRVCEAVQYAHQSLIVHRDLKPSNILVTLDGEPKLLDFGIAKLLTPQVESATAEETSVFGRLLTPQYASPEQVRGLPVTTASDVYSLGVILYELLSGERPYRITNQQSTAEIERAVCDTEPPPPSDAVPAALRRRLRGDLDNIVLKALRKNPEQRYATAAELADDLQHRLDGFPVRARPDRFAYRARKFIVRRAVPLAAACTVIAAVVAGTIATLAESRRAARRFEDVRTLAHSFLFEVYDSISGVPGTLGARRLVASRAQQYLDSLAGEAGNDSALERELAESYLRLGDVRGGPYGANLGDTAGALESYEKAETLLERERHRHPGDIATEERLAHAAESVGRVLTREKNAAGAIAAMTRATGLLEAVCARAPGNLLYRSELSQAYSKLAEAQYVDAQQRDSVDAFDQSLATSLKALDILQTAGRHTEEFWLYGLASRHFRVGYALASLGDRTSDDSFHRRALDVELRGQAVMEELAAAHPEHPRQRELADGLGTIGLTRWKCCRDVEGALRDVQNALDSFRQLAAVDSQDLEARRDVANATLWLGTVLAEAGRREEALAVDRRALDAYQELERADPHSRENAEFMTVVRDRIAALARSR